MSGMTSATRSAIQSLPFLLLDVDADDVDLFSRFRLSDVIPSKEVPSRSQRGA